MSSEWITIFVRYGPNTAGLTMDWLYKNVQGEFKIGDDTGGYRVLFKDSRDAMLFAMRWA